MSFDQPLIPCSNIITTRMKEPEWLIILNSSVIRRNPWWKPQGDSKLPWKGLACRWASQSCWGVTYDLFHCWRNNRRFFSALVLMQLLLREVTWSDLGESTCVGSSSSACTLSTIPRASYLLSKGGQEGKERFLLQLHAITCFCSALTLVMLPCSWHRHPGPASVVAVLKRLVCTRDSRVQLHWSVSSQTLLQMYQKADVSVRPVIRSGVPSEVLFYLFNLRCNCSIWRSKTLSLNQQKLILVQENLNHGL